MSRTYHFEGLGSTIALTNENGEVTDTYSYDAWGNVTPGEANITTDNPYQYAGRYGYYTHYQESGFGLIQTGVRYYDPATGRYTQRDPIGDSASAYSYAENDPLHRIDPSGLSSLLADSKAINEETFSDRPDLLALANNSGGLGYFRSYGVATVPSVNDSYNRDLMTLGMRDCNGNGYGWSGPVGVLIAKDMMQRASDLAMVMPAAGLLEASIQGSLRFGGKLAALNPWKWELHHLLPQAEEFAQYWSAAKLNIHEFRVALPRWRHILRPFGIHTVLGGDWNAGWRAFFAKYPLASADDIMEQMYIMIEGFDLWRWFPGY